MLRFCGATASGVIVGTVITNVVIATAGEIGLLPSLATLEIVALWNFALYELLVYARQPNVLTVWERLGLFTLTFNLIAVAGSASLVALQGAGHIEPLVANAVCISAALVAQFAIAELIIWRTRGTVERQALAA